MEKIAYLRLFGISEIDNVNLKYCEKHNYRIIKDTDGSKLENILNSDIELATDDILLTNMLMYNIDIEEVTKHELNTYVLKVIAHNDYTLDKLLLNSIARHEYNDNSKTKHDIIDALNSAFRKALVKCEELQTMLGV